MGYMLTSHAASLRRFTDPKIKSKRVSRKLDRQEDVEKYPEEIYDFRDVSRYAMLFLEKAGQA